MSKTTLTILGAILMSGALALQAAAGTTPRQHRLPHMPGIYGLRTMGRFAEPAQRAIATTTAKKPLRLDSAGYTIVDHPDADPSWGTRVAGINENSVLAGYYLSKTDGTFHGFLMNGNDSPIDVQVGHNDTFEFLVNDYNETFGSYIDSDTGIEQPWVRTKDGAVIPIQLPDAANGGLGQFVNNKGVLVGIYIDANGAYHCFTRTSDGVTTELADAQNSGAGDGQGTQCIGINNKGEIAGAAIDSNYHVVGFVRGIDGTYHEFEAPKAGRGKNKGTYAAEIDESGRVNGQVIDAHAVLHGFVRDPKGHYTIVDAPDGGTGPNQGTVAVEHCDGGWCVGEYIDSNGMNHGYYCTDWCKRRGELVEFDPPGVGPIGTYVVISSNKAHQIAGTFKDDGAIRHGFVRNP